MQDTIGEPSIRLGITPGVPTRQLSALLALQREEEPETGISLHEVEHDALMAGLREGQYDAGLTLQDVPDSALSRQPLWYENLAVAMPLRHPLLDKAAVTLDDVVNYPIFLWHAENCPLLDQQLANPLDKPCDIQPVASFELMALWVAAGYGIGITAQSRIAHARAWNICMRPFVDTPFVVMTHLIRSAKRCHGAHERFEHRALQVATRYGGRLHPCCLHVDCANTICRPDEP